MWLSIHRDKRANLRREIETTVGAVLFALSSFLVLVEQLRLPWSVGEALSGGPVSGLVQVWNRIADTLGRTNYILLDKFSGEGESAGLFLSLTLLVMTLICYFLIKSKWTPAALFLVLPEVMLGLLFNLHAPGILILFNMAGAIVVLTLTSLQGGLIRGILVSGLILAMSLGIYKLTGFEEVGEKVAFVPGEKILVSLKDRIYGSNDLGSGDLTVRRREIESGIALKITMSEPQPTYLKGYIGSVFDGNRWQPLSDATCYENAGLMEAFEKKSFNVPGQLAQVAEISYEEVGENLIRISLEDADSRYIYTPYEIREKRDLARYKMKGGDIFYAGKFKSGREYSYLSSESQTDNWTDEAGKFFTLALGREEGREDISEYLLYESYYNNFVYENFTYVPIYTRELLASVIGMEGDLSEGHLDYKMAINAVRTYMEDNFIYSEYLGDKVNEKQDEISDFISSGKGYDVQYASLATLIFRYYGIPSRYVEGYLVTPEDVENAREGTNEMDIMKDRIHAWTEIYIDGIGFVPLEVTPEYYGIMPEADMTVGISNEALIREFVENYGNDGRGKEGDEGEEGGGASEVRNGGNDALQFLWWIVVGLGAVGGISILVLVVRWLLKLFAGEIARRKLFNHQDPKVAVSAIYGYMERYDLAPDKDAVTLGNRAAYSREEITEDDRSFMQKKYKELMKGRERKLSLLTRKVELT